MSRLHVEEAANASHVAAVLQKIHDEGFLAFDEFISQFLRCARPSIKTQADSFCTNGGAQRVVDLILNKQDRMRSMEGQSAKDKALADDCIRRMDKDIKALGDVDFLGMKAGSLGPDSLDNFTFQAFDDQYLEKAPFLYQIVRWLCGVSEDQTVSNPGSGSRPSKRRGPVPASVNGHLEESEDTDSEAVEQGGDKVRRKRGARRRRNKAPMATVVISLMLFSNKKSNNAFQVWIFLETPYVPSNMKSNLLWEY